MVRRNTSGIKLQCSNDGYTWFYQGNADVTSCPKCGWRVRVHPSKQAVTGAGAIKKQDSLLEFSLFIFPLICLLIYVLFIKLIVLIFWCIIFLVLFFIILFFGYWYELPPDWKFDKKSAIATYEKTFLWYKKGGRIRFRLCEYRFDVLIARTEY